MKGITLTVKKREFKFASPLLNFAYPLSRDQTFLTPQPTARNQIFKEKNPYINIGKICYFLSSVYVESS